MAMIAFLFTGELVDVNDTQAKLSTLPLSAFCTGEFTLTLYTMYAEQVARQAQSLIGAVNKNPCLGLPPGRILCLSVLHRPAATSRGGEVKIDLTTEFSPGRPELPFEFVAPAESSSTGQDSLNPNSETG